MAAATVSLIISTFLAAFWPESVVDHLPVGSSHQICARFAMLGADITCMGHQVVGLAHGDYTLMPLWVWIYCIIWWFIQVSILCSRDHSLVDRRVLTERSVRPGLGKGDYDRHTQVLEAVRAEGAQPARLGP